MMFKFTIPLLLLLAFRLPAAIVLDEDFRTLDDVHSVCESGTVIFIAPEGGVILGGPGSSGEKAGMTFRKNFDLNTFTLLVENLRWSHNASRGGHPTVFRLRDGGNRGYDLELRDGSMILSRQDGPGKRTELSRLDHLWDPGTQYTIPRTLLLTRNAAGEFEAGFDGIASRLRCRDTSYDHLQSLTVTYGVYMHGYSVSLGALLLRDDIPAAPRSIPAGTGRVGLIDPEPLLHPARRSNWGAATVEILRESGIPAQLIRAGQAAGKLDQLDLLLLPGFAIDERDLGPMLDFLRGGKTLVTVGPLHWKAVTPGGRADLHRFCERFLGTQGLPPEKFALVLEADRDGILSPLNRKQFDRLQLLPQDNSIEKQTLPAYVERLNLATAKYDAHNWISRLDRFTGAVIQQTTHRSGEFAGSRFLYIGLPSDATGPILPQLLSPLLREPAPPPFSPAARPAETAGEVTRKNFFQYPGAIFGTLCFAAYAYLDDPIFVEDLEHSGIQVVCYCVPWLLQEKDGEVVDWNRLDRIVEKVGKMGRKLMLDPYAFNFNWKAFSWRPTAVPYHPGFEQRYTDALRKITERYKNNPTRVAMWASSDTHDCDFRIDRSPEIRKLWADYLKNDRKFTLEQLSQRYNRPVKSWDDVPQPAEDPRIPYNIGPLWDDYFSFHVHAYRNYLRRSIRTLRSVIPDLPITVRGPFIDAALNMSIAAEFPRVATHIECVESSINTEGFYRSYAQSFKIPITAENGWPKASAPATRMALADYLMGNYAALTYSFAGPRWARESFPEFRQIAAVKREMAGAEYPQAELGLLLSDATLYASRPPNLFSIEKLPSLELTLEQMGYPFTGVSAAFPRFGNFKVLLDSGSNYVFSPQLKQQLTDFIRRGGVFIGFPHSGSFCRDGSSGFLTALNIPVRPGKYRIGAGTVILLDDVKRQNPKSLDRIFRQAGLVPPYTLDTSICNTLLERGGTKYLILFDKTPKLVGSFFQESTHQKVVDSLLPQRVTITPEFQFSHVSNAIDGVPIPVKNGNITVELPPTHFLILRFE